MYILLLRSANALSWELEHRYCQGSRHIYARVRDLSPSTALRKSEQQVVHHAQNFAQAVDAAFRLKVQAIPLGEREKVLPAFIEQAQS